jgi:hypothetical protein
MTLLRWALVFLVVSIIAGRSTTVFCRALGLAAFTFLGRKRIFGNAKTSTQWGRPSAIFANRGLP